MIKTEKGQSIIWVVKAGPRPKAVVSDNIISDLSLALLISEPAMF